MIDSRKTATARVRSATAVELPSAWLERYGRVLVIEAPGGLQREDYLRQRLQEAGQEAQETFYLRCDFDYGGPWAGITDLLRSIIDDVQAKRPELIQRHDYELAYALPEIKKSLPLRNPTLTDTSPDAEKVRNYPADRAFRIVHGLIDLLDGWKRTSDGGPWVLACDDFDRVSHIGRYFFGELMRRRGRSLPLILLVAVDEGNAPGVSSWFQPELLGPVVSPPLPPELKREIDSAVARRRAEELEAQVGDDRVEMQVHLPELIRLWRDAGEPKKSFQWRCWGLEIWNTLGLYEDALAYGDGAVALVRHYAPDNLEVQWSIFVKLFMSLAGLNRAEEARELAEDMKGRIEDPSHLGRFCYLEAMLYARFLETRDYARAEALLDEGLRYLEKADLPEADYHFQVVFNRNGLAMIRTFQKRFDEALALCREGFEELESHLPENSHRLHRSVLLYNMAQVYSVTGAHEDAIRYLSAAMEMDPYYSEYYNERGNVLQKQGRYEEALADYHEAIELSPPYAAVQTNLGHCYRAMGRMSEAIEAYSMALDLEPEQAPARIGRGQAHEALGHNDAALADYDAALVHAPESWMVRASRAVLRYEAGQLEECRADLDEAISQAPQEAELYQNRAVVLTDLGRQEEAVADLEQYLRLVPDAGDAEEVAEQIASLRGRLAATV